jgi:hypothetical protein
VFSYIFFDVLDIDGSNFCRLLTSTNRLILIAEAASSLELYDPSETTAPPSRVSPFIADPFEERNQPLCQTKASGLDLARSHGYRVGLPRDSLADGSPYY